MAVPQVPDRIRRLDEVKRPVDQRSEGTDDTASVPEEEADAMWSQMAEAYPNIAES